MHNIDEDQVFTLPTQDNLTEEDDAQLLDAQLND